MISLFKIDRSQHYHDAANRVNKKIIAAYIVAVAQCVRKIASI